MHAGQELKYPCQERKFSDWLGRPTAARRGNDGASRVSRLSQKIPLGLSHVFSLIA
jgi:hypothetical protein